jgi:glutathione synthase/RimK-type ligase-like ATP-grasp enzyme
MEAGERLVLQLFPSPHPLLRLHPAQGGQLGDEWQTHCDLVCAGRSRQVPLAIDSGVAEGVVQISSNLAHELGIQDLTDELTAFIFQGKLRIGPIIGILCNPRWHEKRQCLQASRQLPALQKLATAAMDAHAVCYVFRIKDVDLERERVQGYLYRGNDWAPCLLPLPDVIYDQVISRRLEQRPEYAKVRRELSRMYADRIFNDGFFDKWQVYEWLTADKRTRPYVPVTVRYTSSGAAAAFISRFHSTFCKPVHGSLGLGIVRVDKAADGSYHLQVRRKRMSALKIRAATAQEALERLKSRLSARPYLLQQGIALVSYNERPFDIRILLQRDGSGEWRRTKMFARIARAGEITSNLSSGGEAMPVQALLTGLCGHGQRPSRLLRRIRRVAREVAEVVEKEAGKTYGELGIDLGLDSEERVWVIEVNSKPWKTPESEKGRPELTELAFVRPMQYAIRLATQI